MLTILICTHNRVDLLSKVLMSLNTAIRPKNLDLQIRVIPNACTDDTIKYLVDYQRIQQSNQWIPLDWAEESKPGKSYALNFGIPLVKSKYIAFVDDDHRIDCDYLQEISSAIGKYPEVSMFCGRILPDWDGWEPAWAHEEGEYAVYPLPVPHYDQGMDEKLITLSGPLPGGGNLIINKSVFNTVGEFSTTLGPQGHNLGGGEDSDFVTRALKSGCAIQYMPGVVQHHYVDTERFNLLYVLRKSYQRSCSVTIVKRVKRSIPPKYLWRKLFSYFMNIIFSLEWRKTRFYLVRVAATIGEISGYIKNA